MRRTAWAAAALASLHALIAGRGVPSRARGEHRLEFELFCEGRRVGVLVLRIEGERQRWYGSLRMTVEREGGGTRVLHDRELTFPGAAGITLDRTWRNLRHAFACYVDDRLYERGLPSDRAYWAALQLRAALPATVVETAAPKEQTEEPCAA
jgi:hypothetical protein